MGWSSRFLQNLREVSVVFGLKKSLTLWVTNRKELYSSCDVLAVLLERLNKYRVRHTVFLFGREPSRDRVQLLYFALFSYCLQQACRITSDSLTVASVVSEVFGSGEFTSSNCPQRYVFRRRQRQ